MKSKKTTAKKPTEKKTAKCKAPTSTKKATTQKSATKDSATKKPVPNTTAKKSPSKQATIKEKGSRKSKLTYLGCSEPVEVRKTMPKGWRVLKNTMTQPAGTVWIQNQEPIFVRGKNGKMKVNPKSKQVLLITDEKLFIDRIAEDRVYFKEKDFTTDKKTEAKINTAVKRLRKGIEETTKLKTAPSSSAATAIKARAANPTPKTQSPASVHKRGTKAEYMAKNGIKIRPVTAKDKQYAKTDYQKNADYIISVNGKQFFSTNGSLADCKTVVQLTKQQAGGQNGKK